MTTVKWEMNDNTIVQKTPDSAAPKAFEAVPFKKAKPGEKLNFDLDVVAESMLEGALLKRARVSTNVPGWGVFEIISDEGVTGGGFDSAPSPLMYFSVGVVFCLMTHITILARRQNLKIDNMRVEQRARYATSLSIEDSGRDDVDNVAAGADFFETHVFIDSPEPLDKLKSFIRAAENACIAGQTVQKATPKEVILHVNDENVGGV